jgi:excinuclease UvrABC ATPase subunit
VRGYKAGRVSFNVKGGRFGGCSGVGTNKMVLKLLPGV